MCESIKHRGPDDEGIYLKPNIGLGSRRLKIIDLEGGHQPISNESGKIWLVFNGEIYNFLELKDFLIKRGHQFKSSTDTEVIVHLYEEYGDEFVTKLRGMFAFALWDDEKEKLYLVRDRLGQKPLYYAVVNGGVVFASEITPILQDDNIPRAIDFEALDDYFTYQFIPSPKTIFQAIRKIPPAHMLVCTPYEQHQRCYWSLECIDSEVKVKDESYYIDRVRFLLEEAVKLRLISDVPLGAFLSGGIDSSAIVGIMCSLSSREVKTFSIGFPDGSYNELPYARLAAERFGTQHHEFEVRYNAVEIASLLVKHFGEPFADSSAIPVYYISRMAREYITVALSGDGGDEVFGGYRRYQARRLAEVFNRLPKVMRKKVINNIAAKFPESTAYYGNSLVKKFKRFLEYAEVVDEYPAFSWSPLFTPTDKQSLYSREFQRAITGYNTYQYVEKYFNSLNSDTVTRMIWMDLLTYLPGDILTKVDRMSMAVSLEVRNPFLDHKLVEFASTIPVDMKLKRLTTKYILKKALSDILPQEIIHRRKQGFVVPLGGWFKNDLREYVRGVILSDDEPNHSILDINFVENIFKSHLEGRRDYSYHIWCLFILHLWYRQFVTDTAISS